MIGVTIGIGEKHLAYAREAAKRFEKYTGLKAVIMTEEYLKEVQHHEIFKSARCFEDKVFFLKFFVFKFFADDVFYFDADYCCVDYFYPHHSFDGRFTACRDRIHSLYDKKIILSNVQNYFNAGMFLAAYENRSMFEKCLNDGPKIPFVYGDQCIFNAVVEEYKHPVRYLDKRHNCLDFTGIMVDCDVKAIHNSMVYEYYEKGTEIELTKKFCWDTIAMEGLEGSATVVYPNKIQKPVYLHADGLTSEGNIWCSTLQDKLFLCDHYTTNPRRIEQIYIN